MYYQKEIDVLDHYDVVVAGGGPAGICAAAAAARQGKKTALIERYGVLGGNLTVGCVGPILGNVAKGTMYDELRDLLLAEKEPGSADKAQDMERTKGILLDFVVKEGVFVYLQTPIVDVVCEDEKLTGVIICIGEEGIHFNRDENGAYIPIMPKFTDDKGNAWWYINATDTESYAVQWQARVRKNEYQWDSFEKTSVYTVEKRPEIYVPNVFLYKPATGAYTEYNVTLKNDLQNYMLQVISGNDKGLDAFTKDWQAAGGDAVKEDLQSWYTQYYHS